MFHTAVCRLLGIRVPILQGAMQGGGGVELVAAEFGHQSAAGPVPEPPADQFFERRSFGLVLLGLAAFGALVEPAGFVPAAATLFAAVARAWTGKYFSSQS